MYSSHRKYQVLLWCFLVLLVLQGCNRSSPAEDLEAASEGFVSSGFTGDLATRLESMECLRRAMDSGKLNDKQLGIAYYIRGITQYAGVYAPCEDYNRAIADFEKSIELFPDFEGLGLYGTATERCAMAYIGRGERYWADDEPERALQDANKAIKVCPTLGRGYELRGRLFLAKGFYDLSLADFDRIVEKRPSSYNYYLRGLPPLYKGNYDSAISYFSKAIEKRNEKAPGVIYTDDEGPKKYHEAHYRRALAYERRGDLEKALADAKIAFEAEPNDTDYQLLFNRLKGKKKHSSRTTSVILPESSMAIGAVPSN